MGVLTRPDILIRIINDQLIRSPNLDPTGGVVVEGSSYDLCAGTIIWKESDTQDIKTLHYDSGLPLDQQDHVTLHPGQMMLVVTKEELNMPLGLSATVYSRNQLARDGILALNAGHVDPGYEGSIIIRLINLRAISYTLKLGSPIYTIVFQTLDQPIDVSLKHPRVTRNDSILKATKSVDEALANPLYDLSLLGAFMKKDEFGNYFWSLIKSNLIRAFSFLFAIVAFAAGLISGIQALIEVVKSHYK
jgi:deoxycytidine triphosphate deaminase